MVQVVTTRSWGNRIMNSLFGILIGIALIIGSFILIFWNEGHGLHTAQSLKQAQTTLISIPNSPIDPKNNLRVVYLSGKAETTDTLKDSLLGFSDNVIKLDRKVEMYQWQESAKTESQSQMGGSERDITTYSYQPAWSEKLINSSEFHDKVGHENPAHMPIKSQHQTAEHVTVGDFTLPNDLIDQINAPTTVDLSNVDLALIKNKVTQKIQHEGETIYVGNNPDSPQVGDIKITLIKVIPQTVSIIAQQTNHTLQPYVAPAGQTVSLLAVGQISSDQMIHNAELENNMITWILRIVSLVMMIMGFALIMRPLVVLADVIPFAGTVVGFGTGLVAFICGLGLWTIAIAIAWFAVRPIWAIVLLIISFAICYWIYKSKQQKISTP